MTPSKAVLLVLFGVFAVLGGAYFFGAFETTPLSPQAASLSGSLPDNPVTPSQPTVAEPAPAAVAPLDPPSPDASAASPGPAATPDAAVDGSASPGGVVAPSFDIVRVETDGSIVIAGKASPNAIVEIVEGSTVIGKAVAGSEGDFATVLDDPLKPGDYQIVIRATAADNLVTTSPETAVVSIPETPQGQVLALVEQAGEPSRLITVPEPAPPPAASASDAALPAAAMAPEAQASTPDVDTAPELAAAPPAAVGAPGSPAASPETEAAPQAETETAMAAPQAEIETAVAVPQPETQTAKATPQADAPPTDVARPVAPTIAVEAVEIEGRQIFVAGKAEPGNVVRVYANDILLGDSKTSPAGRFLVEAERDLPVGDYIIRADMLASNGVEVLARAAVPFTREEGEFVAAVAPTPPATVAVAPAAASTPAGVATPTAGAETPTPPPSAGPSAPVVEAAPAATTVPIPTPTQSSTVTPNPTLSASAETAVPATPAPARPVAVDPIAPKSATETETESASAATPGAAATPIAPSDRPIQVAPVPPAGPPAATIPQPAEPAVTVPQTAEPAPPSRPAAEAVPEAAAVAPGTPAPSTAPTSPATEDLIAAVPAPSLAVAVPADLAPRLQSVKSAVIIRRGDSLWRISRRVYGRGVRYSTIYLANQDQIEDPNRIWPGQVFRVPGESGEGEKADMSNVGDQRTTSN